MANTKKYGKTSKARRLRNANINIRSRIQMDRYIFSLDQKDFNKFLDALDKTPADNQRLNQTLTSQAPGKNET